MQLLLDEDQYQRVSREARRRGTSIGAVIRGALDRNLDSIVDRRRAAIERILAADSVEVPENPAALKREIYEASGRKLDL